MRAEELIALASAHGVNLEAARLGAQKAPRETIRRGSNGHSYEVLVAPSAQRAHGHQSYSLRRQAWSVAELGQAAAGVPEIPFKAACYSYAGDRSVYWALWSALQYAAQELRMRRSWPAQVRGLEGVPHFYLEQLAQLVLDEDANAHMFVAAPALYSIFTDVDEQTWRRSLLERFDSLKLRYSGWIGEAMSIMQPRLEDLEAEDSR